MTLIVESKAEPRLAVVEAIGEVDLASVPQLREEISEHIVAGRTNLLVDLQAVTYLDSTGLGVLVGASKAVQAAGGSLRLGGSRARRLAVAHSSSSVVVSPCVPGRGAHGSSSAGRTTTNRSPRISWVTAGSKYRYTVPSRTTAITWSGRA